MKNIIKYVPDIISALRIGGAVILMFTAPLSLSFFIVYTLTGISDALDGTIARKTGNVSEFGSLLDSIADLLFYAVMLIRFLPVLYETLPVQILYCAAAILVLRLSAYITAAVKYRRFASLHTYMNKLTGAAVFSVPYVISLPIALPVCTAVCVIAALASGEELLIHLCGKGYNSDIKTVFQIKSCGG
ncbi:MAG: CDP-alcohol phosphatidyltransferase family protein [Clostridia bacterium]|nr:CDP-alcohol phosphatidyltransferase family protein [Clostridia bacterium]